MGQGLSKSRGQHQRKKLGFVAHFGESDDTGGDEESFHEKNSSSRI